MEATLSIFAWMGVVIIQAIVHYSLVARKRQHEKEEAPLDIALLDEEEDGLSPRGSYGDSAPLEVLAVQRDSLDGDEPQIFFQLLTQTGSEMLHVSTTLAFPTGQLVAMTLLCLVVFTLTRNSFFWWLQSSPSLERIVEEQINID